MALRYNPDGRVKEIQPANGVSWTREELIAIVGGEPEVVSTVDGEIMVVNDAHLLLGLELNIPATRVYRHGRTSPICGVALVVPEHELMDKRGNTDA